MRYDVIIQLTRSLFFLALHSQLLPLFRQLQDHDNRDSREFTIFIATKSWVKTILRPLLEISANDDITTISHCRRLLFFLLRDMTDSTKKALNFDSLKPSKDEIENVAALKEKKKNASQQLSALVSFKEALCTEKAIRAFVNVFNRFWTKELEIKADLTGVDKNFAQRPSWEHVGKVLYTISRLLEIDVHPAVSRPDEVASCKRCHMQLILYLRSVLVSFPGIFLQLGEGHKDRYFDQWLTYLFRILHQCLRVFHTKDLFKVCVNGGLLGKLVHSEGTASIFFDSAVHEPSREVPVPAAIEQHHAQAMKGLLTAKLKCERVSRQNNSGLMNRGLGGRHSRFGGLTYSKMGLDKDVKLKDILIKPKKGKKLASRASTDSDSGVATMAEGADGTSEEAKDGNEELKKSGLVVLKGEVGEQEAEEEEPRGAIRPQGIVRRGVQLACPRDDFIPQAQAKSMKKNITYTRDVNASEQNLPNRTLDRTAQEASVVVASVVDLICESNGLNEMIKRVNNDLLRDDGIFMDDMKLTYFEILSKTLGFNRLKLDDAKKKFEQQRAKDIREGRYIDETAPLWEPDLRNMYSALDKMTENHVLKTMEEGVKRKQFHDVVKAMEVYKEIVCYIRVQLESSNLFHRDYAVAYLYRLFYSTTERTDPLPRLLAEWRPGTYSRRHLNCLVELVHETMKTLDVARAIYSDEEEIHKARKSRNRAFSGIEQYTSAAYRFDINEYFKKLVSNMSVRIYTRILEMYSSNEESINHYAFVFLHRVCHFRLEQSFPAPHPREMQQEQERAKAREQHATPTVNGPLTLMYMLFNSSTLSVMSTMLNDRQLERQRSMQPLLSLMKGVVRCFFESAEKNKCMFVEALFQHPHPHHFIEKLDSVYEAQAYRPGPDARKVEIDLLGYTSEDEERELAKPRLEDEGFVVADGDEGDDGEFDEGDTRVKAVTKDQLRKDKAERRRLKAAEKEARTGKKAGDKKSKKHSSAKVRKEEHRLSNQWSTEEDEKVRELHELYAGMGGGAFQLIAMDSDLQNFGKGRTAMDIKKRCIELGLDDSDMIAASDDDVSVDGGATQSQSATQPQSETSSGALEAAEQSGGEEDYEDEDLRVNKRGSKRSSPTRTSPSPSSPFDHARAAWEETEVDSQRFDEANQAAEGTKRRKMTKNSKSIAVGDEDDGELVDDDELATRTAATSRGRSKVIDDDDDDE